MKKIYFILAFGLLPLFAAIVFVIHGSLQPSRPVDYWAAAPWLLFISILICACTFLIANGTLALHRLVLGKRARNDEISAKSFVALFLVASVITGTISGTLWLLYEHRQQDQEAERLLAMDYITHNDQVILLAGGEVRTFPAFSTSYSNDRNRGRYDFSIEGPKDAMNKRNRFYAIVDVNRKSGKPEFSLACVTTLSAGYRDAAKDECAQSTLQLP